MNKQLIAAFMAVGFSMSAGIASAAEATAFKGNQQVTKSECALLADPVTLGVSANVHGAYACDEATNLVQVGACHEGGSRAAGVSCSTDADPSTPDVTELPQGCTDTTGNSTIPSYKAFFISSNGGVMSEFPLGNRCSESTVVGITGFSG
ncbi:MAG: hypothetical protein ITG07_11060 [Candidimonas sp.]|nr:hypothetical protein [Candidimonas sp.]